MLVPTNQPVQPPPGLWKPSLKLALGVVIAVCGAVAIGTYLGLPSPISTAGAEVGGSGKSLSASPGGESEPWDANTLVGAGTAPVLDLGPFHPVIGPVDYGASDARFGAARSGHIHAGQDVFAPRGTPLVAVSHGVVSASASERHPYASGRGNYLAIYDPELDRSYAYLHLLEPPDLRPGERVRAGQVIGRMGCSGSCFGVHLHFEIRQGKATIRSDTRAIDPLPFLRTLPQAPRL